MNRILRFLLTLHHATLGRLLGPRCRFHPSCSCYARTALARHGTLRGAWLAMLRVGRCHPFSEGGMDPVPERFRWLPRRGQAGQQNNDLVQE